MIAELLRAAARGGSGDFLVDGEERASYGEIESRVAERASALGPRGGRVGVRGAPAIATVVELLALDAIGARPYIFPADLDAQRLAELERLLGLDDGGGAPGEVAPGEVALFTSGTTGLPKAALHTWRGLQARVNRGPALGRARWLMTYPFSAFAGIQVFLHALANGGALCLGRGDPAAMARQAAAAAVTHISSTPTFFRLLLSGAPAALLEAIPLAQITLGGEAADQPLLDRLRAHFPRARVTQVYASTEMGVCFSVHDGRAGFPAAFLDNEALPALLQIREGELHIRSPHAMRGYLGGGDPHAGFFPSGDIVEVRGDRVIFLGRRSERINVGGRKVYPHEVEQVLLEVPGVAAVRVFAVPSSLTGSLVGAEVVPAPDCEPSTLRPRLLAHCRERLTPYKIPRQITFTTTLEETASRKLVRR